MQWCMWDGRIAKTGPWWDQAPVGLSVSRKIGLKKPLASLNKPTLFFWTAQCQGISHSPQREENVGRENVADGNSPSAYKLQEKLEFPWESPGFIPWRRECPVLLGTGVDASLGEAQMGRDDENHCQDSVSFPDGPYLLFVWGKVLGVKGNCLTIATNLAPVMSMKTGQLLYYDLDDCFFPRFF